MESDKLAIRIRMAGGVLLIASFAAAFGYAVATGVVQSGSAMPSRIDG